MATSMRQPRWKRRKEARPGEIVAAALKVFGQRGYAASRLEEVAAEAGVSKAAVYRYFENKEALFEAAVREALLPNLAVVETMVKQHEGPSADLLRFLFERLADLLESDASVLPKLVIAEAANFPQLAEFYVEAVVKRGLALLGRIVARGVARGEFRPVELPSTLPLVIAPVLLMALWKHSLGRHAEAPFEQRRVLQAHLDMLLRGLAPEPPR
jgi:AcrR family transcriptional regulator